METFDAELVEIERGGAYVRVPADVVAALGGKGRIPVRATFDGIGYQGSVVSMGGEKILGVLKDIRTQLGKAPGDVIRVTVERDDSTRSVKVPDDLQTALVKAGAARKFAALSYSHQREHVSWIEEAKRPETRAKRVSETLKRLRS